MKLLLKCPACGSDLTLSIGYTGCDWETRAGENSGYKWMVSLDCTNDNCGRIYPIGYIKNEIDFTEMIDKCKCVK
jgi:hypothetical protein